MNAVDYFSNKYSGITPKNSNLTKAKAAKNDEFYTQYSDIEAELSHYEVKHFADRVVYLPCDDWHFSQFVKYFENNFTRLQLKALVATGINFSGAGYYYKKTSEGVITGVLEGNGDFRSDACRQLMREADIIVTNPPFSLFREFVAQIMEFRKQFIVVSSQNAITYKEFFPLLKDNKAWMGTQGGIKSMYYIVPDSYPIPEDARKACVRALGEEYCKGKHITYLRTNCWFTNINIKRKHEPMLLSAVYNAEKYPKYDNYDAIEVGSLKDIPCDYFGAMGVPITYFYTHCPDQFEIIGISGDLAGIMYIDGKRCSGRFYLGGKRMYDRIVIKRKTIPVEPE